MGAAGVNGGRVLSATLTNELIEPVAEVLNLAGSKYTTNSHKLCVMRAVMAPSQVGMTTNSQLPWLNLRNITGLWLD